METFRQALFLLKLLLRLKSYRFLLCILPIACLVSNTYLYSLFENLINPSTESQVGLKTYGADEFVGNSRVLSNPELSQVKTMLNIIANRQSPASASAKQWLAECNSKEDCKDKFFRALHSSSGSPVISYANFEDYSLINKIVVSCLLADSSELGCPYLVQLVAQSLDQNVTVGSVFQGVTFFDLLNPESRSRYGSQRLEGKLDQLYEAQDSVCTKNKGLVYQSIFPLVIMFQMVLVSTGLIFYVTLGNLSCISRLKRDGFLQLMHQNGLSVGAFWSAVWFLTILEMVVFGVVGVLAFHLQCAIYSSANLLLTFLIILLFGVYISALGYLLSSLIKSFFITLLLMVLLTVIHISLVLAIRLGLSGEDTNQRIARYILLLFPFGHIGEILIHLLPLNSSLSGYHLAIFIVSMLITILLVLAGLYTDFVAENGNGYRLPCLFLFQSGFWTNQVDQETQVRNSESNLQRANIELVSEHLKPIIKVRGVDKTYRRKEYPCSTLQIVTALNRVSCTLYDGQITALIGHNGAGKTTLLKILIGAETPTDGYATIDNRTVTDPLQRLNLRGHLGICHQTDILCSDLTVMQCIELTLISRGFSVDERNSEVSDLLSRLDLDGKVGKRATDLSGGQKRKLCTILALIGDPKVIFLDEPTSGLDPVSRRRLWQILQEYKVGRCIVLCTQFMDEADILADRKIFLSSGSLICAGSSLFLKHAFGCGFILNVSLKSEQMAASLLEALRTSCPFIKLQSQFRTELELMLPAARSEALSDVVKVLETRTDWVEAFGLSQATLDDIFMRLKDVNIGQIEEAFQSGQLSSFAEHQASASMEVQNELQLLLRSQGSSLSTASAPQQFGALMKLNLVRLKRAKLKLCCRFIFPIILLLALVGSLFLEKSLPRNILPIARNISRSGYVNSAFCIKDDEDQSHMNKSTCCQIFGCYSDANVVFLRKNRSTDLGAFLTQPENLQQFNSSCVSFSEFCPIVYSTSWNRSDQNLNRKIHVGVYSRYTSSFPDTKIQFLINAYSDVTTFFNNSNLWNSIWTVGMPEYQISVFPVVGIFIFAFLFSIIPVTYISDPLEDKDSKVRYHLRSMGMGSIGYWLNTFLLHWCQYAVFAVLAAILHAVVIPSNYGNAFFLIGIFLPCVIIGCTSNQLSVYAIGMLFKKPNPITTVLYFFAMMWLSSAVSAIQLNYLASIIIIWLVPPFATVAFVYFGVKVSLYAATYYGLQNVSQVPNQASMFFSNPYVLHSFLAMILHIILLAAFIAIMENRSEIAFACSNACSKKSIQNQALNQSTDSGVKQEIERVNGTSRNPENVNVLEVRNLEKRYGNGVMAVKGVSFGAISGEIFGLLGPNGAGKTTTLAIAVGEEVATSGSCEVCSHNVWMSGSSAAVNGAVGYCPQHNPLFDNITVIEHLEFYSKIRGVDSIVAAKQIPNLVTGLGLSEHSSKQAEQLSGGNKRRLCLAIALLGNPALVVIDEASTGVDPEAKRLIWSAIRGMVNEQRSVVVTTHSMEEVEALCSRVGIMNHGHMIAFGTIQQLRSRYGHAYTLDILINSGIREDANTAQEKRNKVIKTVIEKFPLAKVSEELANRVQLLVPQESIGCMSEALAWLTAQQAEMGIQYFTFYQMSLDQVFVRLIKEHEDVKGRENSGFRLLSEA